jgi:hypothetical protein
MILDYHRLPVGVFKPGLIGEGGVGAVVELGEVGLGCQGGHVGGPQVAKRRFGPSHGRGSSKMDVGHPPALEINDMCACQRVDFSDNLFVWT